MEGKVSARGLAITRQSSAELVYVPYIGSHRHNLKLRSVEAIGGTT